MVRGKPSATAPSESLRPVLFSLLRSSRLIGGRGIITSPPSSRQRHHCASPPDVQIFWPHLCGILSVQQQPAASQFSPLAQFEIWTEASQSADKWRIARHLCAPWPKQAASPPTKFDSNHHWRQVAGQVQVAPSRRRMSRRIRVSTYDAEVAATCRH